MGSAELLELVESERTKKKVGMDERESEGLCEREQAKVCKSKS